MALTPSDKAAAYLVRIYEQLDKDLQKEINDAASMGYKDLVATLQARQARVAALIARAQQLSKPIVVAMIAKGYEAGLDFAVNELRKVLKPTEVNALLGPRDSEAVRILAENATSAFANTEQLVGRRVNDLLRAIALDEAAATLAAGEGTFDFAQRLERGLARAGLTQTNGVVHFVSINGRNYQLGPYTKMVARTTTREAATQAMSNRLQDNNLDLVTIDDSEGPCDICEPFVGNTYSLSGQTEGYELVTMPPYHPNCRCVLTPAAIL